MSTNIVEKYLNEALAEIRPDALRREIARELRCHLAESTEAAIRDGLPAEQAVQLAIEKMGDPAELARRLAEVHRPRLNLWILGPTLALLILSWLAMFPAGRLGPQILYSALGLAGGALLTFTDFARIRRLAWPLYATTVATVLLALAFGPKFLGQPYVFLRPLHIKLMDACPYLFVIALSGAMTRAKWQSRRQAVWLLLATLLAEGLFFFAHSLPPLVLFVVAVMAVMHFAHAKYGQTCAVGIAGAVLMLLLKDPTASAAVEPHTDHVFAYLLATFGKSVGAIALVMTLLLFAQLVEVTRGIRAETPRLVVAGVAALLGGEFAWSLLANLGWAPMPAVGMNYPLLSFGGTLLVVHLSSIGLVLGAYRRRTLSVI